MAGKSTYLEEKVLAHVLKNTAYTSPATVYVGLFLSSSPPTDDGGGTECTAGGSYARQSVAFGAVTGGTTTNSGTVTFPTATTPDWGTIGYFGIFDQVSGGNLLYWGAISPTKTISIGDTASFAPGALTITED